MLFSLVFLFESNLVGEKERLNFCRFFLLALCRLDFCEETIFGMVDVLLNL
jgi:hypothetical protein